MKAPLNEKKLNYKEIEPIKAINSFEISQILNIIELSKALI